MSAIDVFRGIDRSHRLEPEKLRHRKAEKCQRSGVQKVPARHAIAKVNSFVGIKPEHSTHPITNTDSHAIAYKLICTLQPQAILIPTRIRGNSVDHKRSIS
jgi:hypothetical protein